MDIGCTRIEAFYVIGGSDLCCSLNYSYTDFLYVSSKISIEWEAYLIRAKIIYVAYIYSL